MLWISKLFSSNTRRHSKCDVSQSGKKKKPKPKRHQGYLVRKTVSQTGTYKATLTQNTTAKMPVLGVSPRHRGSWLGSLVTDRGLLGV